MSVKRGVFDMQEYMLIGACGLYCGSCSHYKASQSEGKRFLDNKRAEDPLFEECHGCRSKRTTEYCSKCTIRTCTKSKGILHCGLCTDYPCKKIKDFQFDGKVHHIVIMDNLEHLKRCDPEQWLQEQESRWTCECGVKYSWYEERCSECGTRLSSYARWS
jgi:hypothetical protein